MFKNASGVEGEPLKLLIQEKGIGNAGYNNMNGNASVLSPILSVCTVYTLRALNLDFTIYEM